MKYIDIHCHLDFSDYDADREEILARVKENEVGAITIGADLESSKKAVEIAEQNDNVWACVGIHPNNITSPRFASRSDPLLDAGEGKNFALPLHLGEGQLAAGKWDEVKFEKLIKTSKVVGVGECGLDYFGRRSFSEGGLSNEQKRLIQRELFEKQIQFAIKRDKPLMLHIRDAYDDALEILKSYPKARGNVHFFAGDIEIARKFLDLNFTLSFTGVIAFTHDYDEVIKYIPQNSIISETDAPFVAPIPYRGKRNEPIYVIEVVKKLAEIRSEEFTVLNSAIIQNAKKIFAF